jgi:hypothetical protein
MAVLQTPVNCGGITFSTSGALTPSSAKVTVTALEATAVVTDNSGHPRVVSSNVSTGAVVVAINPVITSITMNGNTYAVTAGISAAMAAVDATQLIYEGFTLVTG